MPQMLNYSAWGLILQSDAMTKFVLLALFVTSIICVAIILFKFFFFVKERNSLAILAQKTRNIKNFNEIARLQGQLTNTLAGTFLANCLQDLRGLVPQNAAVDSGELSEGSASLGRAESERLELLLAQSVDEMINASESLLPVLGTSAVVAPLVGLFGTVWGLIHAFMSISQERTADIAVVAPGIAEALLTTLAGLIVAIPAMIFFHYFSNELRKMEHQFTLIADRFLSISLLTFAQPINVARDGGAAKRLSKAVGSSAS